MIIDKADDTTIFSVDRRPIPSSAVDTRLTGYQSLADMIPQSRSGSVLVASRDRNVVSYLNLRRGEVLEVDPMEQDCALRLLNQKLSTQVEPCREEATKLVETLEYLPLATCQAAAYLTARPGCLSKNVLKLSAKHRSIWGTAYLFLGPVALQSLSKLRQCKEAVKLDS